MEKKILRERKSFRLPPATLKDIKLLALEWRLSEADVVVLAVAAAKQPHNRRNPIPRTSGGHREGDNG